MLGYLKEESNITYTQNGAVTYVSTNSECLDLFYRIGALRNAEVSEIEKCVERAYAENPLKTMKILFFARDIRGGLGERRVFRTAINYLTNNHRQSVINNLSLFSEYGRWDDLAVLCDNNSIKSEAIKIIKKQFAEDIDNMKLGKPVSLLAKWLPSVNTSSQKTRILARKIAAELGIPESTYRRRLSALRKYIDIIENRLREKDYTFDYEKQPSRAMFTYRNAFIRNDYERYSEYLENVKNGKIKINTSTLYPYDIIRKALDENISDEEINFLDTAWNNMPEISENKNAIAVIDGSGSMYWGNGSPMPYEAALSLGIYFAEKSHGKFANHFITFSQNPQLIELKGRNIVEKAKYAASFDECANTDIQAVFRLILRTAVKNSLPQSELPETIYIISDMEFDDCAEYGNSYECTNFHRAEKEFAQKGYKLPNVVFWNVNSISRQVPVTVHQSGAALVSGNSPNIFEMVRSGEINPYQIMEDIINSERYEAVCC